MRWRGRVGGAFALLAAVAGCAAPATTAPANPTVPSARPSVTMTGEPSPSPAPMLSDARTLAALIAAARTFNRDYGRNIDGPVWDRWDAASQALISRAEYVLRHRECDSAPHGPVSILGAAWTSATSALVRYELDDVALTDHWVYQRGAWRFDLAASNPDAVALYRLPRAAYLAAVGCAGG